MNGKIVMTAISLGLLTLAAATTTAQDGGIKQTVSTKPEWQDDNLQKQGKPATLGVLVINYESFRLENGEPKEYLNPMLGTAIARTNLTAWRSYQPAVPSDPVGDLVTKAVVQQVSAMSSGSMKLKAVALRSGQKVSDGLAELKEQDMILVLSVNNPRASVSSFFAGAAAGKKFATVIMPMDFVLLSRDRVPLMTYNFGSFASLKTVGEMDVGYDKAEPIKEKVSYRYSLDDLVAATAPIVVEVVRTPFLSALENIPSR